MSFITIIDPDPTLCKNHRSLRNIQVSSLNSFVEDQRFELHVGSAENLPQKCQSVMVARRKSPGLTVFLVNVRGLKVILYP